MNCGSIGRPRNQSIESIDFTNQMPFAQAANRRIAAHGADRGRVKAYQSDLCPHSSGNRGGFTPRVSPANDDNIEVFHQ